MCGLKNSNEYENQVQKEFLKLKNYKIKKEIKVKEKKDYTIIYAKTVLCQVVGEDKNPMIK